MSTLPPPDASYADKIKWYYEVTSDLSGLLNQSPAKDTDTNTLDKDVEKLKIKDRTREERITALQEDFLYIGGPEVLQRSTKKEEPEKKQEDSKDASTSS